MKIMPLNDRNRVPCNTCGTSFTKYLGNDGKIYCNACVMQADTKHSSEEDKDD